MTGSADKPSASAVDARAPEPEPRDLAALLPRDFVLGTATAALPVDGSTPARTTDHHHRNEEGLARLSGAVLDGCRFSISWPRVQPAGSGPVDRDGLDFYDRLVDQLLERGICPMASLFHRDTPLPLEERGGWTSRDTAKRFGEYAALVGERLGDRVVDWVTINEAATVVLDGDGPEAHAPGKKQLLRAGSVAAHHAAGPRPRRARAALGAGAGPDRHQPHPHAGHARSPTASRTGRWPGCWTSSTTGSSPTPSCSVARPSCPGPAAAPAGAAAQRDPDVAQGPGADRGADRLLRPELLLPEPGRRRGRPRRSASHGSGDGRAATGPGSRRW